MKNVIGTIKVIKQIHKKDIVLIKIGKFYYTYGKDAYILSYLFSYKMRTLEEQIKVCAFPVLALNKIISKLEKNKINYILVDKRNQYEVDKKENYKNLNQYEKYLEKAIIYCKRSTKKRIETF